MKLTLTSFLLFVVFNVQNLTAQNPTFEWMKQTGGFSYEGEYALAIDNENNIYSLGRFIGTVDFDPGPNVFNLTATNEDSYIQKLDANGNFVWAKVIGGTDYTSTASITIDNSGILCITGTYSGVTDFDPGLDVFNLTAIGLSKVFVLKLDSDGNFIWAKDFESSGFSSGINRGNSIVHDSNDNLYITGAFKDTIDIDPGAGNHDLYSYGGRDIFILKLNVNGDFIWANQIGGIGYDETYSLAIDTDDNLYVSGWFNDTANFNLGTGIPLVSNEGSDMFIQKLDLNGNSIWVKQMKGNGWNRVMNITLDASNNIYATGLFSDTVDFDPGSGVSNLISNGNDDIFVQKLDFNGNLLWVKQMGGTLQDQGWGITTKHGYVYTTGYFADTVDFNPGIGTFNFEGSGQADAFIQALDSDGNFVWAKQIGGNHIDAGLNVILDGYNNLYTLGGFYDTTYFDIGGVDSNLISNGARDVFIYKQSISEPIGINEILQDKALILSPNPSSNIFSISFEQEVEQAVLTVSNTLKQPVYTSEIKQTSKANIDLSNQPSGIYFLTITLNGNQKTIKLIKE